MKISKTIIALLILLIPIEANAFGILYHKTYPVLKSTEEQENDTEFKVATTRIAVSGGDVDITKLVYSMDIHCKYWCSWGKNIWIGRLQDSELCVKVDNKEYCSELDRKSMSFTIKSKGRLTPLEEEGFWAEIEDENREVEYDSLFTVHNNKEVKTIDVYMKFFNRSGFSIESMTGIEIYTLDVETVSSSPSHKYKLKNSGASFKINYLTTIPEL